MLINEDHLKGLIAEAVSTAIRAEMAAFKEAQSESKLTKRGKKKAVPVEVVQEDDGEIEPVKPVVGEVEKPAPVEAAAPAPVEVAAEAKVEPAAAPAATATATMTYKEFMDLLLPLLESKGVNVGAATNQAKAILKDVCGVDKFKEAKDACLPQLWERISNELA